MAKKKSAPSPAPTKSAAYTKVLPRVRKVCLALPEAVEIEAWGHPTFRAGKTGKMFAAYGEEPTEGLALGLKVGHERQEELLQDCRFFPTPYAAHQGWVSLRLGGKVDWDEVATLVLHAYRQVANKRMLQALDAPA